MPGRLPLSTVLSLVVDAFTVSLHHSPNFPFDTHLLNSRQSATERHIEVGDGLEMYVVMAQGRSADDLTGAEAQKSKEWPSDLTVEEVESVADEEDADKAFKVFCLRRPLKRD